jgi:hypothetical protein
MNQIETGRSVRGTTSVVPQRTKMKWGFSPCGNAPPNQTISDRQQTTRVQHQIKEAESK